VATQSNPMGPKFPWPQTPVFRTNRTEWPVRNLIPPPKKGSLLEGLPPEYFLMMAQNSPMWERDVTAPSKRRLMDMGIFDERDFQGVLQQAPVAAPLGGDPTRQVSQGQYEQMLIEQQKRAQQKYLQYKRKK
jgi:hypothetical protein